MRQVSLVLLLAVLTCAALPAAAAQSIIVEAEGSASMGDDLSKSQTRDRALTEAKRKAAEQAGSHVVSETSVKDYITEKDVIEAYSRATVKIIEELSSQWYREPGSGDCYKVRIKAEVTPDETALQPLAAAGRDPLDDPTAPLAIKVWTERESYRAGEGMKIFLKGNKPFFARVVYCDASGRLVQLLPNVHRRENYFNGGTVYEIPSGQDAFTLQVTPPFGQEQVTVYAGTSPLGALDAGDMREAGGVYALRGGQEAVAARTRGLVIASEAGGASVAEFVETRSIVRTGP